MQNGKMQVEDVAIADKKTVRRAVGAAAVGNITEWYDFGVYGYLATTITKVFFSGLPSTMGTIATFGLFAVSFLIRPFGSLFFGPLGDKIGRKRVLSITVILMALGTFVIGVVPSYGKIGVAAPLLVLLARLMQGVSTGGEYGNAMTFIAEYAPDRKRGFFGSWLEFGTLTGYAFGATIATVLSAALSEDQLLSWGWRIPFLIALPLGVIGLYLRSKLEETPAFDEMMKKAEADSKPQKSEFKTLFTQYWPVMILVGGLVLAWNVTNYMLTSYVPTYLTDTLPSHGHNGTGETASEVLQIIMLVVLMVVITFLGRLSDKIGRRRVVLIGCAGLVVLSFPSVLLLQAGGNTSTFLGLILMGLTLICFSATLPSTLPAMFPTHIRAGGLSISFNVAISLFGGTTSIVMSSLVAATGDLNWPAYYLIAAGVIGAICILKTRESANRALEGSPPVVETKEEATELVSAQS